jgi:hypothetical protein
MKVGKIDKLEKITERVKYLNKLFDTKDWQYCVPKQNKGFGSRGDYKYKLFITYDTAIGMFDHLFEDKWDAKLISEDHCGLYVYKDLADGSDLSNVAEAVCNEYDIEQLKTY